MKKIIFITLLLLPNLGSSQDSRPKPRNVCSILMNVNNDILVRGEPMNLEKITPFLQKFIVNPTSREDYADAPKNALVIVKRDKNTNLLEYKKLCNAIQKAYDNIWNEAALARHGRRFSELSNAQQAIIKEKYPKLVAENISTGFGTVDLPFAPKPPPPPPPVIRN